MKAALAVVTIALGTFFGPVVEMFGGEPDWGRSLFGLVLGIWILESRK